MSKKYIIHSKYSIIQGFKYCLISLLFIFSFIIGVYLIFILVIFTGNNIDKHTSFTMYPSSIKNNKSFICFNNSNSLSYKQHIKELNDIYNMYGYGNIYKNKFNLDCIEIGDFNFIHNFSPDLNLRYYCLNTKYWGYNQSRPCIIFLYFNSNHKY